MSNPLLPLTPALFPWCVVILVSAVAAGTDLHRRRIPNLLTFGTFFLGLGFSATGLLSISFFESLGAGVLLALPYVFLYCVAGGGAGDAKLMAALGSWLGLVDGLWLLMFVCMAGVAQGLLVSYRNGHLGLVVSRFDSMIRGVASEVSARRSGGSHHKLPLRDFMPPVEGSPTMPYGVSICAGTLCAFAVSAL